MKKRKILNICMVAVILFTILCGVMTVAGIKGWFLNSGTGFTISEKKGIATIERQGVSYELKNGDTIKENDIIRTNPTAEINITGKEDLKVALSENTEILIEKTDAEFQIKIKKGEVFADTGNANRKSVLRIGKEIVYTQNAVLSLSAQKGAQTIQVFSGSVDVSGTKKISASAGDVIAISKNSKDISVTRERLKLQSLNEFQIANLRGSDFNKTFCLSLDELENLEKERENEQIKSQQALLLEENESTDSNEGHQNSVTKDQISDKNSNDAATQKTENSDNQATSNSKEDASNTKENAQKYCTIEIRCDTILNNMVNLTPGKEGFVPANGTILATSKLEFSEGETVFEVLKRACEIVDIQLEYSYTPLYGSYYIEGINNLYEFDCGEQSGWMYKVNGWFPNYGCSSYTLKDGDVIVWCYTCNGLGADVGGSVY